MDGTTVTTCDVIGQTNPDYCDDSSCTCTNRCGWTHCDDDDIQFFKDLLDEIKGMVCVDTSRVYSTGFSNGGMFSWSLGQDNRTAPLLAGIGPIMGLPHWDYLIGKATASELPVIGISGSSDCINPPGDGTQDYTTSCDGDGYYMVDAKRLHKVWALDHECSNTQAYTYDVTPVHSNIVECETYCNPNDGTPAFSVDCRADLGHSMSPWMLDVVLTFFDDHADEGGGDSDGSTSSTTTTTS